MTLSNDQYTLATLIMLGLNYILIALILKAREEGSK
jgi:hypothetical protein